MSRKDRSHGSGAVVVILTVLIIAMIFATAYVIKMCLDLTTKEPEPTDPVLSTQPTQTEPEVTEPETTEETKPDPVHVVSTATITSTGDLLMHKPVYGAEYNSAVAQSDGTYDFESIFRYISEYTTAADYAVANLETTLAGLDTGYSYSGFPTFNSPDSLVDGALDAGFDMLLTANNHCYDTRHVGLTRTLQVLEEKGMASLGTMKSAEDPKYLVVDINDIKVGMLCYTYSSTMDSGLPNINGIPVRSESQGMINTFDYSRTDAFYAEVEASMAAMEAEGAEAYMLYIHWGFEYNLRPHQYQTSIAQKLCDLGIDVIVGGHPHVVQPMDLLESTVDPDHKTVCIYSLGNAVSNQRLGNLSAISTAHTEDGVLFSVTFSKYSDGTVVLEGTDLIPCWVNMHSTSGKREYNILPLDYDKVDQWQSLYGLTDAMLNSAKNSYDRTTALVGEGLEECQYYLAVAKELREWTYLNEVDPEAAGPMPTMETEPPTEETGEAA